jgi:predicted glutamine amidotransferase
VRDEGADPANGDGFGVGRYSELGGMPGLYKSIQPALNDHNLLEFARAYFVAALLRHIRASNGTAIQETNAHPFRHGRWLFMHNGYVREFPRVRRDLLLAVAPALFAGIEGLGDSEVLFHLALTFGREEDPLTALSLMVGFVEEVGERHGVEHPLKMTVATSDGELIIAARYSSNGKPGSLYFSTDARKLKAQHPCIKELQVLSDEARAIISEPLRELVGAWNAVPESSIGIVQPGPEDLYMLTPYRPGSDAPPPKEGVNLRPS